MPMGADLYGGLAGQALFLAYLGAVTEEARYTRLAREALTALRRRVERDRSSVRSIGGFDGWGGIIYTLTHLGSLWGEPALLAEAEAIVGLLPDLIESDERFDIIAGAAGCIGGLLGLQRIAPLRSHARRRDPVRRSAAGPCPTHDPGDRLGPEGPGDAAAGRVRARRRRDRLGAAGTGRPEPARSGSGRRRARPSRTSGPSSPPRRATGSTSASARAPDPPARARRRA